MTKIKLPPLPEWSKMDNLNGLVPSEIRQHLTEYATAAIEADRQARKHQTFWYDGEPPFPQNQEWFIAETTFGDRIVLTALPKAYSYDYKTADDTHIKADRIKRWAQFPDCEYLPPDRQARGEPIGEVLAFPMDGKPQTHSTLAGLENPQPVGMLVYATPQTPEGYKLVPKYTIEFVLRAMARNYSEGHSWDHLDIEACEKAADEIRHLRAMLEAAPDTIRDSDGNHPTRRNPDAL